MVSDTHMACIYYMHHWFAVLCRSICELNLEAELFTLQDSNSKLVAALHEANANVEQWKKQLAAYQEETERLRDQVGLCWIQSDTRCPSPETNLSPLDKLYDELLSSCALMSGSAR